MREDVVGLTPRDDPLCEDFVVDMKQWISTCIETHIACSSSISGQTLNHRDAPLPTRSLKVDGVDSSGALKYHLEETSGQYGRYLTLSHRWLDDTMASKTTMQNYEERKVGKEFNLPHHFRDALLLAFKLDIPFVWIDSICIIQDGNDFKTEALKMADYYQNSVCTLAVALDTKEDGLSLSKIPTQLMPRLARLPYRAKSGQQEGHIYIYRSAQRLVDAYTNRLANAEIFTRGWIFQEWCLSRRVACFTSNRPGERIFFHCQSELPRNEVGDVVVTNQDFKNFFGVRVQFTQETPLLLWQQWQLGVRKYSSANLTQTEDRIIALAGIANECRESIRLIARSGKHKNKSRNTTPAEQLDAANIFSDAYVAGLWLQNIHAGLLWEQNTDREVPRSRVRGIPTWSWASVLVPVIWRYQARAGVHCCNLLGVITKNDVGDDVETSIRTAIGIESNPSRVPGSLDVDTKFGVLRLSGRLFQIHAQSDVANSDAHVESRLIDEAHFPGLDSSKYRDWRNILKLNEPGNSTSVCGWCSLEHPDFQRPAGSNRTDILEVLPISKYIEGDVIELAHIIWNILLLRKVTQRNNTYYERVGVGRVFGPYIEKQMQIVVEQEILLC